MFSFKLDFQNDCKRNELDPQLLTQIVRLAPLTPLLNLDCEFGCLFLVSTAWHDCFTLFNITLSEKGDGILGSFKQVKCFFGTFL